MILAFDLVKVLGYSNSAYAFKRTANKYNNTFQNNMGFSRQCNFCFKIKVSLMKIDQKYFCLNIWL